MPGSDGGPATAKRGTGGRMKRLRPCDYAGDAMHELCELSTEPRAMRAIECFEAIFKNTAFGVREINTDTDKHRKSRGFVWLVFMSEEDWDAYDLWDCGRISGAEEVLSIALRDSVRVGPREQFSPNSQGAT